VRPQITADDLVAEYKAWVTGDLDGHDKAVEQMLFAKGIRPPGVQSPSMAYGQCACVAEAQHQVRLHLDREIAVTRNRLKEQEARLKILQTSVGLRDAQGWSPGRYKGTLPKWMTE